MCDFIPYIEILRRVSRTSSRWNCCFCS